MPESLCTCINSRNNNTTYFIVDSNVSLSQLRDHVNVFVGNEYTISNENGEITNDSQLKSLYVNSNFQVIINPTIKEEGQKQPEIQEEKEEEEQRFVKQSILEHVLGKKIFFLLQNCYNKFHYFNKKKYCYYPCCCY